jgi:hypothetical protein
LRDEEKLPVLTHRIVESPPVPLEQPDGKTKKHHHHDRDKSRSKDKEKKYKKKSREHHSSKSSKKVKCSEINLLTFMVHMFSVLLTYSIINKSAFRTYTG